MGDNTWEMECRDFHKRIKENDLSKNNEALEAMAIAKIIKDTSLS